MTFPRRPRVQFQATPAVCAVGTVHFTLDPPRTISVQQDANRNLGSRERQVVNRRQQTEIASAETKLHRQSAANRRIDGPEQKREVVPPGRQRMTLLCRQPDLTRGDLAFELGSICAPPLRREQSS
jgi:hypothetical protein